MPVDLSVVIPVYNEEENLALLLSRLLAVVDGLTASYQILVVDDGSRDGTVAAVRAAAARNPRIELLSLARNFGHQVALSAGLDHASGDVVVTMDGDLQHPPERIPDLLDLYAQGNDVVYTVREAEERLGFFKRWSSVAFYRLFNRLSPIKILEASSDFRLLSRRALDVVRSMPERHRFLRGLVPWTGLRSAVLEYAAEPRHAGTAKYSPARSLGMALDAAFSFSRFPLQMATFLGVGTVCACFVYFLYSVGGWWLGEGNVIGWTSLIATVLFIGGVQLLFVGILGEYVGRIYEEVKRRPLYVVAEHVRPAPDPLAEAESIVSDQTGADRRPPRPDHLAETR